MLISIESSLEQAPLDQLRTLLLSGELSISEPMLQMEAVDA